MRKQILKTVVILLCALSLVTGKEKSMVYAKTEQSATSFSGDVTMLKQENNGYVMQVTVENRGEDFTGTVQVIFAGQGFENCAYNTEIVLPAQGKKQFTINVTNTAVDTTRGICKLNFLDERGNVLQSVQLKNLFGSAITEIPVGVLSDDYAGLDFMEAKGETFYIDGGRYPLKLTELNNDNLKEYLDGLYFLIIDQFDVSSLSKENIEAIQDWVKGGGSLMIGTGEYAQQTLSGFDKDFIDVSVLDTNEPGEENIASVNIDLYGYYYYMYTDDDIDFTNMTIANLYDDSTYWYFYESTENPAICGSLGEGAVMIFYFSLGDAELQKLSSYTVTCMYEEVTNHSSGYYQSGGYSEWGYIRQRALAFIDNVHTNVDFTGLKVMIILYVVLIGPVLYLILRKCKKCEWYWICVPVLGVLFIAGVYFGGQGMRVNEARVYSVTAQRADSSRKDTYVLAYHAGTKPWEIRLRDDYEMAGPSAGWGGYYYGSYGQNIDDYYYTVKNDSEGLSVGIKPEENFDSGFFYVSGRAESKGTISCENLTRTGRRGVSGTITNETIFDMPYMAVYFEDTMMVFSDIKAGETIDLEEAVKEGRCIYDKTVTSPDGLFYDMIPTYNYRSDMGYEADDMAALLIGLGIAEDAEAEQAVIVGVVRNYDKAAVSKSNELSYGCLYSYAEVEGGQNASN